MKHPSTGVVFGSQFQAHDTGLQHPENPARSAVLETAIEEWQGPSLERVPARAATLEEILRVHDLSHVEKIAATRSRPSTHLDPDTVAGRASDTTARQAAGGLLDLIEAVDNRSLRNGFAFVRPPGHHATRSVSQGFCLFNNVAIAAMHLLQKYDRIAIVDFDVHHGNGTEEIFAHHSQVFYASLHQSPWYPGTGAASDIGYGTGAGYTANVPLPAGAGDAEANLAMNDLLLPILYDFAPEFVLVSAGFDGHRRDPLGSLAYTEAGFHGWMGQLATLAEVTADGRIAAVLEGGYDPDALASSAQASLAALSSPERPKRWQEAPSALTLDLRKLHRAQGPLAARRPGES